MEEIDVLKINDDDDDDECMYYLGSSVGLVPAGLTYVFAKGKSDRVRDQLTPKKFPSVRN